VESPQRHHIPFERELWFDRDIDGRWLVGVVDTTTVAQERIGAIVVRDVAIGQFIELLGQLVANPDRFADEPVLAGPA
jgi:hypothetical protein